MTRTTPSPERSRLAAALRELKQRTGLSLAALAERTPYSKSSWDRYLNGRTLPPRQAVRDLCRLAREPEGRCLALWEIAESEWSGRATEVAEAGAGASTDTDTDADADADAGAGAGAPKQSPRGPTVATLLVSVCAVVLGCLAAALLLLPDQDGGPRSSVSASLTPSASADPTGPRCRGAACEGKNPLHMVCGAGPDTLASHLTATGARMELRYSEACGAGWARMWGTRIGDRIQVSADGRTHGAEVSDEIDAEAYVYTAMLAIRPGTVLRACFRAAAGGERECFDSRAVRAASPSS
ncbi:DUF2690 domain-containing protein [Streptomyces sp. NPDC050619]|uniref:helix-turn-helix domain-containing protein n=1 Tax=Streptomyces sp. NPDC050619 TaxID=3157214 RepID=UPI00342E0012